MESSPEKPKTKHFTIDARAMLTWGRDSIKDHTTAVLELVKNSYDAGASIVQVTVSADPKRPKESYIRITDDGMGMTEEDIDLKWLRIGYSDKRSKKKIRGRRKTGEKGIGRISADRLGQTLGLRSQAKNTPATGLIVDWRNFEKSGKDLAAIAVDSISEPSFDIPRQSPYDKNIDEYEAAPQPLPNTPSNTGTELFIRDLRQTWTPSDIRDLVAELSVLTSPLNAQSDFQIRVETPHSGTGGDVVTSPFYKAAHFEAIFEYKDGDTVHYEFHDRDSTGSLAISDNGSVPWKNFVHQAAVSLASELISIRPTIGPIRVHLLFYLRDSTNLKDSPFSLLELREFLDYQAGIKVYRDNIRVMPYGDPRKPEGDWLGLGPRKAADPAGAARPTWKVAPTQLIGNVFLSRDFNPGITDTSGREGLIHGEDFIALKTFMYGCLLQLEAHYHREFLKRVSSVKEPKSPRQTIQAFSADLQALKHGLKQVENELPKDAARSAVKLRTQLSETMSRVSTLRRSIEQLASQATIYRGLATLGIAVATFGHEIESSLDQFVTSAYASLSLLQKDSAAVDRAIIELQKSIAASEKVGTWGAYALRRVKKNKRTERTIEVHELMGDLLDELKPAFSAARIMLSSELTPTTAKIFPMDMESIVINLLTNAYFFAQKTRSERRVRIVLEKESRDGMDGYAVHVSDSGPGVAPELSEQIWEPLFTTKVDRDGRSLGTGLGLGIIDTAVKDSRGARAVSRDPELGGAKFTVWFQLK